MTEIKKLLKGLREALDSGALRKAAAELLKQDPDLKDDVDKLLSGTADAVDAAEFAYYVLGRPWPEAEDFIAADPQGASYYATEVIKGAWPKGEAAIAKDGEEAFNYASTALYGRFPAGEAAIAKSDWAAPRYAREILSIDDEGPIAAWRKDPNLWAQFIVAADEVVSKVEKVTTTVGDTENFLDYLIDRLKSLRS